MSSPASADSTKELSAKGADAAMRAGMQLFWRKLKRRPYDFDLFFALRMLQARHPDLPRLGTASRPQFEPIRLGQDPSLAFAPATIAAMSIEMSRLFVGEILRVDTFFCLFSLARRIL